MSELLVSESMFSSPRVRSHNVLVDTQTHNLLVPHLRLKR